MAYAKGIKGCKSGQLWWDNVEEDIRDPGIGKKWSRTERTGDVFYRAPVSKKVAEFSRC